MGIDVIHVLGASGSGVTTLGQNIEQNYGYKWLDTDDYFWLPTEPLFSTPRPIDERISLMETDITKNSKCVISGSLCGWGDVFISKFQLVIFIYTPAEIRKERLIKREYQRYGEKRLHKGGDRHEEHIKFINWAMDYDNGDMNMRSLRNHEEWLKQFFCPVIRLDGTDTIAHNLSQLEKYLVQGPLSEKCFDPPSYHKP